MAKPGFGRGTVPQTSDTKRTLLLKRLLMLQAIAGAKPGDDPTYNDPIYRIRFKIDRSLGKI